MKQTQLITNNYADLKKVVEVANDLGIEPRELAEGMDEQDFSIGDYRFIHEDSIDEIMQDEMKGDTYMLGCFNAWFIADCTDLSMNIVEALQKGEQYSEIGEHIIDNGYLPKMQEEYASQDGYGHHFAHYDNETNEELLSLGYYIFSTN